MNRRALLTTGAAAASVPAWGAASATATDPAIEAVRAWARLLSATEAHADAVGDTVTELEDCPRYRALDSATDRAFRAVVATTPTTLTGMAAMVRCYASQDKMTHVGSRFEDIGTWLIHPAWADGRDHELLMAILAAGGQNEMWETQA